MSTQPKPDPRVAHVRDDILANARADADRAHRMHDEASDEVDRLRAERRQLRRALRDLADRMDERSKEADAPADGIAMGEYADEIRALIAPATPADQVVEQVNAFQGNRDGRQVTA